MINIRVNKMGENAAGECKQGVDQGMWIKAGRLAQSAAENVRPWVVSAAQRSVQYHITPA